MARFDGQLEFSLDCELLWGMRAGLPECYIVNNVGCARESLGNIVSTWGPRNALLYLAFVGKSLPQVDIDADDMDYLSGKGYKKYLDDVYLKFPQSGIPKSRDNIKLGLHGITHRFYTDMSSRDKQQESQAIEAILGQNREYTEFFVYPKNLADDESIGWYRNRFRKIRVNSRSWLYRTNEQGVGTVRRIFRFLDSFLPLFELFCDKKPEHNIDNAVVGTHFFRANLVGFLLGAHYARLRFGIWLMRMLNQKVHIWSHPHNFAANPTAIRLFGKLAQ